MTKRNRKLALVGKAQLAAPTTPQTMNDKLQAAIDWLGDRYVLSKNYEAGKVRVPVLNEWRAAQNKAKPLTAREGA